MRGLTVVGRFETAKPVSAGFGKCPETLLPLPFLDSGERVKKLLAVAAGLILNVSAISDAQDQSSDLSHLAALPPDRRLRRNNFARFFERVQD
jgi:hypothetical protein